MTRTLGGGQYVVGRLLGEGGMGAVYEGVDAELERPVAIKILEGQERTTPGRLARFRREAKVTGALAHPNIVAVYDVSIDVDGSDPPYMVMERVEGRTLSELLKEEGAFEPERAMSIGLQLLSALSAAHEAGVVHRDLKPANLMITAGYDGGELLRVLDFGVARLLPETGAEKLTRTGQVLGTLNYMAPEQASGERVDARADVYAAGACLWAMLAGRSPIPGKNAAEVMARVLRGDHEPLGTLRPELGELAELVERAMATDPDDRFASAARMRAALAALAPDALVVRRIEAPAPTLAKTAVRARDTASAETVEEAPDRRWRWLLLGLLALLAAGAAALLVIALDEAERTAVRAPAPTPVPVAPAVVETAEAAMNTADAAMNTADAVVNGAEATANTVDVERNPAPDDPPSAPDGERARAPSGPTCDGVFGTYGSADTRHNEHVIDLWEQEINPVRSMLTTRCLGESRPGRFDMTLTLNEASRITRVRFDNNSTLSRRQRRCFRRVLVGRSDPNLIGPDDLRFYGIEIRCY